MSVARLALTDFRSYAAAEIVAAPGFVVLTGDNGTGKTNVLEALSLLTPGRGLRGVPAHECARDGSDGSFAIAARLVDDIALGTGTEAAALDRRIVRINGATRPAIALSEWLSIVWLTPAMDRLFTGSAGERRRFLDRLVLAFEPAHAGHSTRYEAAMRQRNRLLGSDVAADPAWLDALEAAMADQGTAIVAARARLVETLGRALATAPPSVFARAELALDSDPPDLRVALREGRARDAAAGRTLAGPHRHDLHVTHADKRQPAARCSTGEQKALLIGIVLAHAALVATTRGAAPLLLLDEVAAHLDPSRRAALFERVAALGGQAWLTGTEPMLFDALPGSATRVHVTPGRIDQ